MLVQYFYQQMSCYTFSVTIYNRSKMLQNAQHAYLLERTIAGNIDTMAFEAKFAINPTVMRSRT
jgi:hypothetical protein